MVQVMIVGLDRENKQLTGFVDYVELATSQVMVPRYLREGSVMQQFDEASSCVKTVCKGVVVFFDAAALC